MRKENLHALGRDFPLHCRPTDADIPDGWFAIVRDFYLELDKLCALHPEKGVRWFDHMLVRPRWAGSLRVFVTPIDDMRHWTGEMAARLLMAADTLSQGSRDVCHVCGLKMAYMYRGTSEIDRDQYLCEEHGRAWMSKIGQKEDA